MRKSILELIATSQTADLPFASNFIIQSKLMQEVQVGSLDWEDPLEEEMAKHLKTTLK